MTSLDGKPILNPGSIEGPFLIGVMACCPLVAITCCQTIYYYRTYPKDNMFTKLLVGVLCLLEFAHVALLMQAAHFVYVICKLPENQQQALVVASGFAISVIITAVVTITVQSFYAWRVYTLSKHHRWGKFIVVFILLVSFSEFCIGMATTILLFGHPPVNSSKGHLQRQLYSATLLFTIICDLTISLALVYFLNRMRSGVKSSENVINRLILFSINAGLLTSAIAFCTLVSFYATPSTSIFYSVFVEINGKFYVNSMLVTLNSRKSSRKILGHTQTIPLAHLGSSSPTPGGSAASIRPSDSTAAAEERYEY